MLRIAFEGPDENFDNFIKEAIALWKNGIKYQFICAHYGLHVMCLLQVVLLVQ